jgi:hypothetical protein
MSTEERVTKLHRYEKKIKSTMEKMKYKHIKGKIVLTRKEESRRKRILKESST